jgi:hypothetical protein
MAKTKGRSDPYPGHDDYRAHADLHTLIEAEKIKRDPKRLKACMCKKREMHKDLSRVGSK